MFYGITFTAWIWIIYYTITHITAGLKIFLCLNKLNFFIINIKDALLYLILEKMKGKEVEKWLQ